MPYHRRARRIERRGAAAVEFAATLPFLLYLCVIGIDWARLMYFTIAVENCARNGAVYECDPVMKPESPYADVTAAALGASPGLSPTGSLAQAVIWFSRLFTDHV